MTVQITSQDRTKVRILNLTQHLATPEQQEAGVVEPRDKEGVKLLLSFSTLPSYREVVERASALVEIAIKEGAKAAMIGGAPYLMAPLERALRSWDIRPLYAFSRRESVEEVLPDGSVRKTMVFRHLGFVEAEA